MNIDSYINVIHKKYEEILQEFPNLKITETNSKPIELNANPIENKCEIENDMLNFLCPHCKYYTQVSIADLNCRIFRHGGVIQKHDKYEVMHIGPHESEEVCNALRNNPNVTGCCKPFQIVGDSSGYFVQICGYI